MRFWPIKSLISSPFIEIPVHFRFNSGMVPTMWYFVFSIFTPIKWYQARLLVEEGGVISIGVVRVTYRKPGCEPLWVPYVGVYVLQLLWGMWYLLDIIIISALLWLTCTNHWLDKRQTWLIFLIIAAASYVLSNAIYWYVMNIKA